MKRPIAKSAPSADKTLLPPTLMTLREINVVEARGGGEDQPERGKEKEEIGERGEHRRTVTE